MFGRLLREVGIALAASRLWSQMLDNVRVREGDATHHLDCVRMLLLMIPVLLKSVMVEIQRSLSECAPLVRFKTSNFEPAIFVARKL